MKQPPHAQLSKGLDLHGDLPLAAFGCEQCFSSQVDPHRNIAKSQQWKRIVRNLPLVLLQ
jgi:hypothetical protein